MMSKLKSFLNELIASVRTHGATWMWIAIAFMIVFEGFAGGWVLNVPHVLIYIGYGVFVTFHLMEVRTQSLLREKEREIEKLAMEQEELRLLRADIWFLVGYLLPYLKSAVRYPRDLAKGCGLNTVLGVVWRMFEKVELSLQDEGDLARFQGRAKDFFGELREELDRVAPPRRF